MNTFSSRLDFFRRHRVLIPIILLVPILSGLVLYLYSLFTLLRSSFLEFTPGLLLGQKFTLANYIRFLSEPIYSSYLLETLKISMICSVASLILGYPVAYYLARIKSRSIKALILLVMIVPNFTNIVVRMQGWTIILRQTGVANYILTTLGIVKEPLQLMYSEFSVVVGIVHYTFPFVILSLMGYLQGIDPMFEQAAQNLGAGKWQTFCKIIFPLSVPGLVVTSLLAYASSVTAFVIPLLMGGGHVDFMSTLIYDQINAIGNIPFAAAASFILLFVSFAILLIIDLASKKVKV